MKHLLIGDNAFIGVSHLSKSWARQKLQQLRLERVVEVIEEGVSHGATGFAFSVHPTNLKILGALEETGMLTADFEIWPVMPYAAGYVRTVNEKGMRGLISDVMSRLPLSEKGKAMLRGGASLLGSDPVLMLDAYVDMELARIRSFGRINVRAVLLHEVITDLGLSFQAGRLFDHYMRYVREKYGAMPGFVTRNLVMFAKFFEASGFSLEDVAIMTPVNKIGFQMNPSRESCEACLSQMTAGDVVAMSLLAGGYLPLEEAVQYLQGLGNVSGVVVGVSSKEHAERTFGRLASLT